MNDDNNTVMEIDRASADVQTPGSILRKLREDAGLSQAVIGEALHLTVHYVKALESDEYGKLPGLTFVKGYLRSYARYIRADVEQVMASFEQHRAGLVDAGQRTEKVQRSRRRNDQALRWAIATSVILVLGIAGGWWFTGKDDASASSAQPSSTQAIGTATTRAAPATATPTPRAAVSAPPVSSPAGTTLSNSSSLSDPASPSSDPDSAIALSSSASQPAPATAVENTAVAATADEALASASATGAGAVQPGDRLTITPTEDGARMVNLVSTGDDLLELSFSGNSWVEVEDGTSLRLYSDMLRSGDALTVHGAAPFHVLLGDATTASVRLNSEAVDIAAEIRGDSTARLVLANRAAETTSASANIDNTQTATGAPR